MEVELFDVGFGQLNGLINSAGIMRDGMGKDPAAISKTFADWNEGVLQSYLIEISAKVTAAADNHTGTPIIDMILDRAGQKGTGRWTLIEALKLGQSASAIEAAVAARSWSSQVDLRAAASEALAVDTPPCDVPDDATLEAALLTAKLFVALPVGENGFKSRRRESSCSAHVYQIAKQPRTP